MLLWERSKALTTEGTEDHRGNRELINVDLFTHYTSAFRRVKISFVNLRVLLCLTATADGPVILPRLTVRDFLAAEMTAVAPALVERIDA